MAAQETKHNGDSEVIPLMIPIRIVTSLLVAVFLLPTSLGGETKRRSDGMDDPGNRKLRSGACKQKSEPVTCCRCQ